MTKFVTINTEDYKVYSIIEVENVNTFDGLEFPENVTLFIPESNIDTLPQVGQVYNPETNKFE